MNSTADYFAVPLRKCFYSDAYKAQGNYPWEELCMLLMSEGLCVCVCVCVMSR